VTVAAQRVELGDSLLCRKFGAKREPPPVKRGDMVLVRVQQTRVGDGYGVGRGGSGAYVGETVGQLIALPGDELELTERGFAVNGRALDPEKFPVPKSLQGQKFSSRLVAEKIFCYYGVDFVHGWQARRAVKGGSAPMPL